jgi:Uma2 family endonuclease
MSTLMRLGPVQHGQPLTNEEFVAAGFEEGFRYELIDGRLYVAAAPNLRHDWVTEWITDAVKAYARAHPDICNHVSRHARVFVPGRPELTTPEPDIAAYCEFSADPDLNDIRWEDFNPLFVVEIPSADDPDKDLVRNVELYRQVPSIKEYWLVDNLADGNRPSLRIHRRSGQRWRPHEIPFGATYTTRLLPGFSLLVDPRR